MKITKHAQSCLLIETKSSKILVDPGFFVFTDERLKSSNFQNIDLLIITHEHTDHFDLANVKEIISNNQLRILCTEATHDILVKEMFDLKIDLLTDKSKFEFSDFIVDGFLSKHGPLPSGNEPPVVCGFKLTDLTTNESIYDPGDTIVLVETGANIVATPICGTVVLNIDQAKSELIRVDAKIAIPIHYDNAKFPVDVKDFEIAMQKTEVEVKRLNWGESYERHSIK